MPRHLEAIEESINEESLANVLDNEETKNYINLHKYLYNIPDDEEEEKAYAEPRGGYDDIIIPPEEDFDDFQDENPSQVELECGICLEKFSLCEFMPLSTCECIFCLKCFNQHLEVDIKARKFPIKCPLCKCDLIESDILSRLDYETQQNYHKYTFSNFVNNHSEFSSCPTPDCQNVFIADDQNYFNCPACGNEYCLRCKVAFHTGLNCEQYKQKLIDLKTVDADKQFLNFVKGTNYKQCPQCRYWVEKSEGCNHMTCRCKYQFCYACGGKYQACACGRH